MESIYIKMWELAKPYYENGQYGEIEIMPWLIQTCNELCISEELDDSILMPLIILHDTGYSMCPYENPKKIEMVFMHMRYGAQIANEILSKLRYDDKKSKKIIEYISKHDSWRLGHSQEFKDDYILALFSDLKFLSMLSENGFKIEKNRRGLKKEAMLDLVEHHEKLLNRPLSSSFSRELYKKLLNNRKLTVLL